MTFRVKLDGYRCFKETEWITVRPLTLLIGNNSSGKTSFLAATRYLLSSLGSPASATFNSEPFYLGAFDQIAHYRGGKAGRVRKFQLAAEITPSFLRAPKILSGPIRIHLDFSSASGQPINSGATIEYEKSTLRAEFGAEAKIFLSESQDPQLPLFQDSPSEDSFRLPRVTFESLKYVLSDMRFIARANKEQSGRERQDRGDATPEGSRRAEQIGRILAMMSHRFIGSVSASAPVRTRPERTYQPVEEGQAASGSEVPLLLARLSIAEKDEWLKIKSALDNFGRASGLFDDITIRRLGKGASDPFQVHVKISGPLSNLVDVGYGVSQVLPLVTEILRSGRSKTFLFQQPEVHLHPSAQAELGTLFGVTAANKKHSILVETHSDYILDRIRMDVRDKRGAAHDDVMILFFEKKGLDTKIHEITIDELGNLVGAPPGYRGFFIREELRSLGGKV